MDILARAEGFFLDAMAQGWAAQVAPKSMPQSDWVQIAVEDPIWGFRLTDSWGDSMGANKPVGISLMTQWDIPSWIMWHGGDTPYQKKAIPTLQDALLTAYSKKSFCGGRGERVFLDEEYMYLNIWSGNFAYFKGNKMIINRQTGGIVGSYRYWGKSLLYFPDPRFSG